MDRREFRENLFKLLFIMDYHEKGEYEEQAELFIKEIEDISSSQKHALKVKYNLIIENLPEIDKWIEEKSDGWSIDRIAKADLAVLRLSIFEVVFDPDTPVAVAIKEALRIITDYGTEKSGAFVNGILASIVKDEEIKKVEKNEINKK